MRVEETVLLRVPSLFGRIARAAAAAAGGGDGAVSCTNSLESDTQRLVEHVADRYIMRKLPHFLDTCT